MTFLIKVYETWLQYKNERAPKKHLGMAKLLDVAGFGLVAVAAGMVTVPLGLAVAGVSCFLLSWKVAR